MSTFNSTDTPSITEQQFTEQQSTEQNRTTVLQFTNMLDGLSEEQLKSIAKQIKEKTDIIDERNKKLDLINCATKRNELYTKFVTDNSTQLLRISEINTFLTKQVALLKEEQRNLVRELTLKFNDMAKTCQPYCSKLHYTNLTDSDIPPAPANPVTRQLGLCDWSDCEYCNKTIHYDNY